MQVEEKRACPTCGAENGPDADFCWKCYARFVPPPPPPGRPGQAAWGRMPRPEPAFQPSPPVAPEPAAEPSLGSSLIASGILRKRNIAANDPLAPIRRMSQAEKIAFFS